MKRALSLILVLAMVLCLVPFSAFAEGEEWNLNGDYSDGTVALSAAEPAQEALYTATEAGTVCFYLTVPEGVEGVNVYIDDILYENNADIAVNAGDTFCVTVAADNGWDDATEGTVSISSVFTPVPGTEGNPLYLSSNNTTVIVPAGSEVWYNLYGASYIVSVNQGLNEDTADFSVYHKNTDTTYAPDVANWIFDAQFNGVGTRMGMTGPDVIKITNNLDEAMYYIVKFIAPEGHQENPMPIYFVDEAVEGTVAAGSQGFYYTYTPTSDGTLSVTVGATDAEGTACGWTYTVNNLTSYAYGDTQWSDSDPVVNPWVVEVSKGDEIQIIANTYDPADAWNAPAGKVSVTLSFEAAEEEPVTPAEPVVAEFNDEQMSLSDALAAATASAPTAENRAVVTLIANAEVDYTVVIDSYVTLNIAGYTLTAPNVIGLSNSMINAAVPTVSGCTDGGKIYVPTKNNLVMSAEIHDGSKDGCKLLPVWHHTAEVGHYLFTNITNKEDTITDVSGQEDYGNCTKCMFVKMRHTWSDSVVKTLINDKDQDCAENALTFTYEASWNYYDVIRVYQQYEMIGAYVNNATNGWYGGDTGEIDGLTEFTIQSQVVSDTGAIFYGTLFTVE